MTKTDTIYTRGFLSAEIESYRSRFREQYSSQFDVCEEKADIATVQIFATELGWVADSEQTHVLLALAFWCRCVRTCQGSLLLLERGLIPEGQILIRSAYEFLFIGAALLRDASVEERLFATEYHERRKQAQAMLDDCPGLDDRAKDLLREVVIAAPKAGKTINAYEAAKISGYLEFYATVYRGMSLVGSHGTLSGTNSIFEDVDESRIQMVFGPSDFHLDFSIGLIDKCLAEGLERFKAVLASGK
jgi:hypothetical protein